MTLGKDRTALPGVLAKSARALRCIAVLLAVLSAGCGSSEQEKAEPAASATQLRLVRVAAASDLKFALAEIIAAFEKETPEIKIEPTFGASGLLYSQLSNKAPFDVFLSADISYPRKLVEQGLALSDTEFVYAYGELVLWTPKSSGIDVEKLGVAALSDPKVRKIAIANPQHAPYGRAAEAALKSLGVYDAVKDRLVPGENIAAAAQFVESGSAEVGLIALSLAVAPPMRDKGVYWPVPASAFPRLEQGGVILSAARYLSAAEKFRAFLISERGREILTQFGFNLPKE